MSDTLDKPRILLIGGSGSYSGVPRHLTHICATLKDQAHITVLTDRNEGGYDALRAMDVTHREIPGLATILAPMRILKAFTALKSEVQNGQYDLVWAHARLPVILSRLMWRTLSKPRPRLAVTFHGLPFSTGHHVFSRVLSRVLETLLLGLGPQMDVVFLTVAQKNMYLKHVPQRDVEKLRSHVLGNCSDLGPIPLTKHQSQYTRLIMTGRAGFQKNLIAAARLFSHLPATYRLDLYGPSTDDPHLRARFGKVLSDTALERVGFHGPTDDVAALLAKADGYLLTSRYEGLPIGALEAMEAGLPAILPKIEGTQTLLMLHPYSVGLGLTNFEADAKRVESLLARYLENREAARKSIRLEWENIYSPEMWAFDLHRLVADLTYAHDLRGDEKCVTDTARRETSLANEGRTTS